MWRGIDSDTFKCYIANIWVARGPRTWKVYASFESTSNHMLFALVQIDRFFSVYRLRNRSGKGQVVNLNSLNTTRYCDSPKIQALLGTIKWQKTLGRLCQSSPDVFVRTGSALVVISRASSDNWNIGYWAFKSRPQACFRGGGLW